MLAINQSLVQRSPNRSQLLGRPTILTGPLIKKGPDSEVRALHRSVPAQPAHASNQCQRRRTTSNVSTVECEVPPLVPVIVIG